MKGLFTKQVVPSFVAQNLSSLFPQLIYASILFVRLTKINVNMFMKFFNFILN